MKLCRCCFWHLGPSHIYHILYFCIPLLAPQPATSFFNIVRPICHPMSHMLPTDSVSSDFSLRIRRDGFLRTSFLPSSASAPQSYTEISSQLLSSPPLCTTPADPSASLSFRYLQRGLRPNPPPPSRRPAPVMRGPGRHGLPSTGGTGYHGGTTAPVWPMPAAPAVRPR